MTPPPPPVAYIEAGRIHPKEANRPHGSGQADLQGLAATIRNLGILVPLLVSSHPRREGHYLIEDGHRRYKAGQIAGLTQFPCTLRRPSAAEKVAGPVLTEVVANTQRAPWTAVEFALKLGMLRDGGLPVADIAQYTGLSQQAISYHLELLDLDPETLQRVRRGEITVGAAHEAVKSARAAAPQSAPGPREVKPRRTTAAHRKRKPHPYFDATHPLAAAAHKLCTSREHPAWQRIGKVACGPCWESAVRQDQDQRPRPVPAPAAPVPAPVQAVPFRPASAAS